MSFLLALTTFPVDASPQNTSQPSGPQKEYAPLTPDELDGLVAPIALYPDALVAQVLGAATFPYEVEDAVVWMKQNSSLKGETLAKAVDQKSWDPVHKTPGKTYATKTEWFTRRTSCLLIASTHPISVVPLPFFHIFFSQNSGQ